MPLVSGRGQVNQSKLKTDMFVSVEILILVPEICELLSLP